MGNEIYEVPVFLEEASNYLLAIRNLSKEYIEGFRSTIRQFLNYLNTKKFDDAFDSISKMTLNDIRVLKTSDIYSFMFYLSENNYRPSSRVKKTEYLRLFFDYLYRIKHNIFQDTLGKIERNRNKAKQLPNALSLDESKKLLSIYSNSKDIGEIRDNAILHLILNCGLRLSEVVNLNISDFKMDNNTFTIFGKGNKERTGYLNKATKNALLKYLSIRRDLQVDSKKDEDALFLTTWHRKLKRLEHKGIQKLVRKALFNAGLEDKHYTTHSLRHTCATLLYRNGIDIKVIKELLGHVRIDTTEIYTHLYDKDVEREMLNHPLGRFKMRDAMNYQIA